MPIASSIPRVQRQGWFFPVAGCWLLLGFVPVFLLIPHEHGSIFVVQPALFVSLAGALWHCAWLLFVSEDRLSSLLGALPVTALAMATAAVGTSVLWKVPLMSVLSNLGDIFATLGALACLSFSLVSRLYIASRVRDAIQRSDA